MKKFLIITMAGVILNMTYASSSLLSDSDSESKLNISSGDLSDISSPMSTRSLDSFPLTPVQNDFRRDFEISHENKSTTLPYLGVGDRAISPSTSIPSSLGADLCSLGNPKAKTKIATRSSARSERGFGYHDSVGYCQFTHETTPPPLSTFPSLPHRSQESLAYPSYPDTGIHSSIRMREAPFEEKVLQLLTQLVQNTQEISVVLHQVQRYVLKNQAAFSVTDAYSGTAESTNFPSTNDTMNSVVYGLRFSSSASPESLTSSPASENLPSLPSLDPEDPEIYTDSDVDSDATGKEPSKDE